jgi:purine-binding chemotaxis protein CheW
MAGAPAFILGLARIRGAAVPVVDLARVLEYGGSGDDSHLERTLIPASRFVSLRVEGRCVALAVQEVLGVRTPDASRWETLPPLLAQSQSAAQAIGTLDSAFFLVLESARLIPEDSGDIAGEPSP